MDGEQRVALVTGSGRGIGRSIALALAASGFTVVANYRSNTSAAEETLQAITAQGASGLLVQADIALEADRAMLLDLVRSQFGRLDVLVNNAGMVPRIRADLLEMTSESYHEVLSTNLHGPFFLTQSTAQWMAAQVQAGVESRPVIINIGLISAYTASLNRGEYCIAKAGMAMMTALFAARLAEYGVCVYEVRPGIIATDMTAPPLDKYSALIKDGLLPIARMGQPEDVAKIVVLLAQGALPYSTGEVINVDGGFHLRKL